MCDASRYKYCTSTAHVLTGLERSWLYCTYTAGVSEGIRHWCGHIKRRGSGGGGIPQDFLNWVQIAHNYSALKSQDEIIGAALAATKRICGRSGGPPM